MAQHDIMPLKGRVIKLTNEDRLANAITNKDIERVKQLLPLIDINSKFKRHRFAKRAIVKSSIEICELVLSHPDIDLTVLYGCNDNLIHLCVEYKKFSLINFLVYRSININHIDEFGNTPLHCAIEDGSSIEDIRVLLDNGADKNINNNYGLDAAELAEYRDLIELAEFIESYIPFDPLEIKEPDM